MDDKSTAAGAELENPEQTVIEEMDDKELEAAVESILFASGEPVHIDRICVALSLERPAVERVLHRLSDYYAYERRGIRLVRMEDSWQLCSSPDHGGAVRKAFEVRKAAKLSQPALEALTIIAYYQPTTRAYVDKLRGVDSGYTVGLLVERGLIEECGRLQVPGRPRLYRTTQKFLRSFHLDSLDDLPPLPESGMEGQTRLDDGAGEGSDRVPQTAALPAGRAVVTEHIPESVPESIEETVEEPETVPESTEETVEKPDDVTESAEATVEETDDAPESTEEVVEETIEEPDDAPESMEEAVEEPGDAQESIEETVEEPDDVTESMEEAVEEPENVPESMEETIEEPDDAPESTEETIEEPETAEVEPIKKNGSPDGTGGAG